MRSGGLARHPKFQALVRCLQEQAAGRDAWHGIVFCRTREAARTLARLLQAAPELQGAQASLRGGAVARGRGLAGLAR